MACFAVPAAEAVVATLAQKSAKAGEAKEKEAQGSIDGFTAAESDKIPFSRKLKWLTNLLWGGSALLAFEHVWHGEVIPAFPFLTAVQNAESAKGMLMEMATAGVSMTVAVTAVWLGMLGVVSAIEKKVFKQSGVLREGKTGR